MAISTQKRKNIVLPHTEGDNLTKVGREGYETVQSIGFKKVMAIFPYWCTDTLTEFGMFAMDIYSYNTCCIGSECVLFKAESK